MRRIVTRISLFLILTSSCLVGLDEYCCEELYPVIQGHIVSIGPEWNHITRDRKGGTKQHGDCFGARLTYDHIKRYNVYWGGEASWYSGTLNGHQGSGDKIRSQFTNAQIEGYLGYTFQTKCYLDGWITPILGVGYIYEKNRFKHPSPLTLEFTTKYTYLPFGFLSGITIATNFALGLNVKLRWPIEPKCHISKDEEQENSTQNIEEKLGYKIEIPLLYQTQAFCRSLLVGLLPSYELRHYGGKENFPFDFFDTKLRIYGLTIQILYQF